MRTAPADMDDDDIQSEIESLSHYMEMCAENEQGISTKDTVRLRQLRAELLLRTPAAAIAA